jgi:DNA-binding IclR family transcriptional regulator
VANLSILECFLAQGDQSAEEIRRATGLPRSTLFREIRELTDRGFLYRNANTRRYALGPKVLHLGLVARRQLASEEVVGRPLLDLLHQVQETVTLSLTDAFTRVCALVFDGPSDLRQVVNVGSRYPLHLGAAGHAILAFSASEFREAVIAQAGLDAEERAQLEAQLAEARQQGYAVTTAGHRAPGLCAVAAPVFVGGYVHGSIACAGPEERMREHLPSIIAGVVEAARQITALYASASAGSDEREAAEPRPRPVPAGVDLQ